MVLGAAAVRLAMVAWLSTMAITITPSHAFIASSGSLRPFSRCIATQCDLPSRSLRVTGTGLLSLFICLEMHPLQRMWPHTNMHASTCTHICMPQQIRTRQRVLPWEDCTCNSASSSPRTWRTRLRSWEDQFRNVSMCEVLASERRTVLLVLLIWILTHEFAFRQRSRTVLVGWMWKCRTPVCAGGC